MKKKLSAIFLIFVMMFSMVGCTRNNGMTNDETINDGTNKVEDSVKDTGDMIKDDIKDVGDNLDENVKDMTDENSDKTKQ